MKRHASLLGRVSLRGVAVCWGSHVCVWLDGQPNMDCSPRVVDVCPGWPRAAAHYYLDASLSETIIFVSTF